MLSGRLTSRWRTRSETTRKVAWRGTSRYKTSCLNSRSPWISSRRTWSLWRKESKEERHRQKYLLRMTRHWHLWRQLWHQLDLAQVSHRRRRCRPGLQSQHHRHCRRCDLQGIARQGWAKCQWAIPWLWRWKTWSRHLLRWSTRGSHGTCQSCFTHTTSRSSDGDRSVLPSGVYADSGDAGLPQSIPLISIPEQSAKGTGIRLV